MKRLLFLWLIVFFGLYSQSTEKVKTQEINVLPVHQSGSNNPYGFPTEVKVNPDIQLQTGTPPALPILDIKKVKENLKPQTAEKIANVQYRKAKNLKKITTSRAEVMASYKAMVIKQTAEQELKNLVRRGATDEEIEAFKMQTDERILQTRYEIMKAFGKPEEIKETEEAIMKFNIYKNMKVKEEK